MNNLDRPHLKLDGLDIPGLYLEDVAKIYQHSDKRGYRYLTIFMIDATHFAVPATPYNTETLLRGGHHIFEYNLINSMLVQEESPDSYDFHRRINAW